MADTKISQLPAATTPLSGAEVVPLVQSGATVQTPANEISKLTAATANTFTVNQVISVTDNTNAALRVTQLGTGNAILVEDSANPDSSPFVVTAAGDVGIGTTSPSSYGKFAVLGGDAAVVKTSGIASQAVTSNTVTNSIKANDAGVGTIGTDSNHALWLMTNNTARVTLDTSGTLLAISSGGLGYGTGSGGTVTQLTSKSTGVTLNKTNGQITMNAAALANGASVAFNLTNSTISNTDLLLTNCSSNSGYTITCTSCTVGSANIRVTNVSGGSLSEAVVINFAVIKAATS